MGVVLGNVHLAPAWVDSERDEATSNKDEEISLSPGGLHFPVVFDLGQGHRWNDRAT